VSKRNRSQLVFGALVTGTAFTVVPSQHVFAQAAAAASQGNSDSQAGQSLDEVIVVGLRASIARSQEIKRKSDEIVDVISATDVGKFPDHDIADSLSRVTGVSVSREGGEGKDISIRGFPSQYNAVTLNGRIISSESQGRGFNFDILASELISSAEVYKTSNASLTEGGIGGLVNIATARPLAGAAGLHFAGQLSGNYDTQMKKTSPRYSGTVSWANDAKTLGATASLVYDERTDRNDIYDTGAGWFDGWGGGISTGPTPAGPLVQYIHLPETSNFKVEEGKRQRKGFFTTLQFAPSDRLTLTLDGLLARFKADLRDSEQWNYNSSSWGGNYYNAVYDQNHTLLSADIAPIPGAGGNFIENIANRTKRNVSTDHVGFNVSYALSDTAKLSFDASLSKSMDKAGASRSFIDVGEKITDDMHFDNQNGGIASYTGYPDPYNPTFLSTGTIGLVDNNVSNGRDVTDQIGTYRVDFKKTFEGGLFKNLNAGVDGSTRTKAHYAFTSPGGSMTLNDYYSGFWLNLPAGISKPETFNNFLEGVPGANIPHTFLTTDAPALLAYLQSPAAYNQENPFFTTAENATRRAALLAGLANGGLVNPVRDQLNSGAIKENTLSAFIQTKIGGDMANRPWSSTFGVRYTRTNLVATGWDAKLIGLTPIIPGDLQGGYNQVFQQDANGNDAIVPIAKTNSYHDFLPSMNIQYDLAENVKVRFAYSKTLTRPDITTLGVTSQYLTNDKPTRFGGDPKLRPYKSKNLDAGIEWYINKTDSVSLAVFQKTATDFPEETVSTVDIFGVRFIDHQQTNALTAKLRGFELATQYGFGKWLPAPFDGLGVIANYTVINQDRSAGYQIPDLGNSYNLIGYYEKGPAQFRLAYNWSGESVACHLCGNYDSSNNIWAFTGDRTNKAYGQLDFSASFQVVPQVEVFAEGTNLTKAHYLQYEVYTNRVNYAYYAGRRFTLGVRGKF
jgi:TonB-dependent receptor